MAKYECSQCGKTISRYGSKSADRKYHFCNDRCRGDWMKKHTRNYNSDRNRKYVYMCVYCKKLFDDAKTSKKKICDKCFPLYKNFKSCESYHRKRGLGEYSISDYCRNIVVNLPNHVNYERASIILDMIDNNVNRNY